MKYRNHSKRYWTYLLPLALILFLGGCAFYHWENTSLAGLTDKNTVLDVYLVDRSSNKYWAIDVVTLDSSQLSGKVRSTGKGLPKFTGTKKERLKEKHILMYVEKDVAAGIPGEGLFTTVPLNNIEQIKVYEYSPALSIIVSSYVIIIGAGVVVLGILLLSKGASCPFIYTQTPEGALFEGEIYSGATSPQMERDDWLPLRGPSPPDGIYRLTITNEVPEIQHTNLLELISVDHPAGTKVLFDKYGKLHTLSAVQSPVQAADLSGSDVLPLIAQEDSLRFFGNFSNETPNAEEAVILSFRRPPGAQSALLQIHAKNSMWLDASYKMFLDEFGRYSDRFKEQQMNKSREERLAWMLNQNIPLSVWLETKPGQWSRTDWFNLPGPMALRSDVLPLDLSQVWGDTVRVKLSTGFLFWEIDQVGMDFSRPQPASARTLRAVSAFDQKGIDHTQELNAVDDRYYDQAAIGDAATVVFEQAPGPSAELQRSYFLHARGHYEILHEAPRFKPDRRELERFREPNSFPVFARAKWKSLQGTKMVFGADAKQRNHEN